MNYLENPAWRWAAALASGVMLARALNLNPVWWLTWIAPLPLLAAALRARAWEAPLMGFAAGLVQALGWLHRTLLGTRRR